jgi:YbbR domain-containing protein
MVFPVENFFDKKRQKIFFSRLARKIFFEDWVMKLVALIITLALWFGVTGLRTTTKQRFQNVPLNIRVSNNIEITNSPVTEVTIVLSGDKRQMDQLNPRDLIVSLDLTDIQPGETKKTVAVLPENVAIELPQGVKLEEIQPNKISVEFDTVEEREIPVRAEIEGAVAEGFEIYGKAVITPQKIRVRGPSSFIRKLEFVSTEKINVANRREDFTAQQIPLNVVNPQATLLDSAVDVAIRIGEKRIERLFLVPVQTENGQKKATVILYGSRSVLETLNPENLQIELVKTDSGEVSPRLNLPAEMEGVVEIKKLKINP